jgi:hypothetical protein
MMKTMTLELLFIIHQRSAQKDVHHQNALTMLVYQTKDGVEDFADPLKKLPTTYMWFLVI